MSILLSLDSHSCSDGQCQFTRDLCLSRWPKISNHLVTNSQADSAVQFDFCRNIDSFVFAVLCSTIMTLWKQERICRFLDVQCCVWANHTPAFQIFDFIWARLEVECRFMNHGKCKFHLSCCCSQPLLTLICKKSWTHSFPTMYVYKETPVSLSTVTLLLPHQILDWKPRRGEGGIYNCTIH